VKDWLKHAFAVDPPGEVEPTPDQQAAVDRVCEEIAKRHMVTPMLLVLETIRPLNYLGSQAMHFFRPFVSVFLNTGGYQHFAAFLEQRGSIDYLCRRIEEMEAERSVKKTEDSESADDGDSPDDADTLSDPDNDD